MLKREFQFTYNQTVKANLIFINMSFIDKNILAYILVANF